MSNIKDIMEYCVSKEFENLLEKTGLRNDFCISFERYKDCPITIRNSYYNPPQYKSGSYSVQIASEDIDVDIIVDDSMFSKCRHIKTKTTFIGNVKACISFLYYMVYNIGLKNME